MDLSGFPAGDDFNSQVPREAAPRLDAQKKKPPERRLLIALKYQWLRGGATTDADIR
jgi:hypothetical protein